LTEIDTALAASRDAVDQLIRAGEQSGAAWTAPRAPGKWSPSQIVEHVAGGLEEAANMAAGRPTKVPKLPVVVRPIARLIFRRVLRKAAFPKVLKPTRRSISRAGPRRRRKDAFALKRRTRNSMRFVGGLRRGPTDDNVGLHVTGIGDRPHRNDC